MYEKRMASADPGLLVLLVDHSFSMSDPIVQTGTNPMRKIDAAAWGTNNFLYNITQKCSGESKYKDYLSIAVISYGDEVGSALTKIPYENFPVSVNEIVDAFYKEIDDPQEVNGEPGSPLEWINTEQRLGGRTPMKLAFTKAEEIIKKWLPGHENSFPPIICNISDGIANDINHDDEGFGSIIAVCKEIQELKTNDGNAIIANCHITDKEIRRLEYPCRTEVDTVDDFLAQLLFEMSSDIPDTMRERGKKLGIEIKDCSKFFVYGADLGSFGRFFKFGTDPTNA